MKLFSATTEQYASKEKCIKWLNEGGTSLKVSWAEGRSKEQHINIAMYAIYVSMKICFSFFSLQYLKSETQWIWFGREIKCYFFPIRKFCCESNFKFPLIQQIKWFGCYSISHYNILSILSKPVVLTKREWNG